MYCLEAALLRPAVKPTTADMLERVLPLVALIAETALINPDEDFSDLSRAECLGDSAAQLTICELVLDLFQI